jgi:hypothetical protein
MYIYTHARVYTLTSVCVFVYVCVCVRAHTHRQSRHVGTQAQLLACRKCSPEYMYTRTHKHTRTQTYTQVEQTLKSLRAENARLDKVFVCVCVWARLEKVAAEASKVLLI